jgi:hypothetical protein
MVFADTAVAIEAAIEAAVDAAIEAAVEAAVEVAVEFVRVRVRVVPGGIALELVAAARGSKALDVVVATFALGATVPSLVMFACAAACAATTVAAPLDFADAHVDAPLD